MIKNRKDDGGSWGIRHLMVAELFICLAFAYAQRVNLSVAIVAMTDSSINDDFQVFKWNEKTKSVLLSSFFWGYVVTQVPAGQLAERYGPKVLLLLSMILCSLLTLVTPTLAGWGGWKIICCLRFLQGLCQGFLFPSCHTILSKWAPIKERAQLCAIVYSGGLFGTVLMLACSGSLSLSALGWPSLFYFPATLSLIWSVVWYINGSNSPAEYQGITTEEIQFISQHITDDEQQQIENNQRQKTPWLSIFTSIPFWSILVVHMTQNWGFWTLLTQIPTYMKSILNLNIKKNALLSALPYTANLLLGLTFSFVAEYLTKRNYLPLKYSRKIFNSIGHWIPMFALIGMGYVTKDDVGLAVILLTLAVGLNGATHLGFQCNHIDLAPNFAGTMMGITNCFANVLSFLAPLSVGFIVDNEMDASQWRIVFFIAAFLYFLGNLFFVICSKTEVQPWNYAESDKNKDVKSISSAEQC